MSNTFKQVIPTANKNKNNKDYSFDHVTTQTFMLCQPIMLREVVPNMTLDIHLDSFTRLAPMVAPAFGRARVNNRLFFVPYRTIFPRFTEFIQSEPIYSMIDGNFGLLTSVPVVQNSDLLSLLVSSSDPGSSTDYDYIWYDGSLGTIKHQKYTASSKIILKIVESLGYKINMNSDDSSVTSALPLLAYAKVLIDWYYPSQYINSSIVSQITPYFQQDSLNAVIIPSSIISYIFILSIAAYNDSIYVDAWDRPTAPNNGTESAYSIPDITYTSGAFQAGGASVSSSRVDNSSETNNTPLALLDIGQGTGSNHFISSSISQYQHDILKALTDYTTRHRLAGVRAVDRYLAEYGINLSSEIMKRSILLGSDTFNIQFGDVMSHSDTMDIAGSGEGALLGDYSGKGIGYGNHQFTYNLGQEFGLLIMINTVIPEVGYYQGINRINKHLTPLDFWHADFDGLGVQAMSADEVFVPGSYNSGISLRTLHDKVFGFVPRYAEYKSAPSLMTGDFAHNLSLDLSHFTFMRDLSSLFGSVASIQHDVSFVTGGDSNQYNRIFYSKFGENFRFIHHFEISQTDETSPLYDTYDFKEVKKAVEVHTQASKVN